MSRLAEEQWKPDRIGKIRLGDVVKLSGIETQFEVIGLDDPLVMLRAPSGREIRAGWRAVRRMRR